jgi:hypothetical protein
MKLFYTKILKRLSLMIKEKQKLPALISDLK